MKRKQEREILVAYTGQPGKQQTGSPAGLTRDDRVEGLLHLAEQLQTILVPVYPDPNFRRRLDNELLQEARRRQVRPEAGLLPQHRKGILLGAAAAGSVASVLGVAVIYLLRHRHRGATHIVTG